MRDMLAAEAVMPRLESANKKQVLLDMSRHAAGVLGLEDHAIFDVLWERERLGSTGVGHGIAIPHGRIAGLTKVRGCFARLAEPVQFESVDSRPVDLVFLLLAPESAGADHLHALATVSRIMRDPALCDALRKAKDAAAIYRILTSAAVSAAA